MGEFGHSHATGDRSAGHQHVLNSTNTAKAKPFYIVITLNLVLFVVTLAAGLISGSMTLISNAIHVIADLAGLIVGLVASWLSNRPVSIRHSFGMVRLEVLGALATTVLLVGVSLVIFYQALLRLFVPSGVTIYRSASELSIFGIAGLFVSLISVIVFVGGGGEKTLRRSNILHFASDAIGWVLAIVAGFLIQFFHAIWADATASLIISLIVLVGSAKMIGSIANILLDAAPSAKSVQEIEGTLLAFPGVSEVHHLHVWRITSANITLSAHLVMSEGMTLHRAQEYSIEIKERLAMDFGIHHATLELECHLCDSPTHTLE